MISSFFTKSKFNLDDIPPVVDLNLFKDQHFDGWYLSSHNYQDFSFSDDVFTEDEVNSIIKLGNLFQERQAEIGGGFVGGVNKNIRDCQVSWITPNDHTVWIYERLTDIINQANEEIFKFNLTKIQTLQFTKYNEKNKEFYNKHTDAGPGLKPPEDRKLSIVVQLSDPSEYEGGDLCLYTGKDPIIVQKKKGRVVFFPSYMLHEVTPVTKGTRYTLVGWIVGPPFK